jgi:hypothetical protein
MCWHEKPRFRSWLNVPTAFFFMVVLLTGIDAFAATSNTAATTTHDQSQPSKIPSRAVVEACLHSVAKDSHDAPDEAAMNACLTQKGFPPSPNSVLRAAAQACQHSAAKDARGRPDEIALYACMTQKGFPPPPGSVLRAALRACQHSVAKDAHGTPDKTAVDVCLKQKGVTLPLRAGPKPAADGSPGSPASASPTPPATRP